MSLPWKSELQLRLGRDACTARWLAPWSRRTVAEASAEGSGPPAARITAAVQALRDSVKRAFPRQARLLVPDEHAYFTLRPAQPTLALAVQDAREHFARTLDGPALMVQVVPLHGSSMVLASAVELADVEAWREALRAAGLALDSLQLALVDDLNHVAEQVDRRAIVALMREDGMTLVRIADGAPVELGWERCDQHSARCIEQRLIACQAASADSEPEPLLMLCRSEAQRQTWKTRAQGHGWTLLLRGSEPLHAAQVVPA